MKIDTFIERAKAAKSAASLAYLLAPVNGESAVTDKSANARGTAALNSGASLTTSGLVEGADAVALDGFNDYIDTGWRTRTNLIKNPSFEVNTNTWTGYGTPTLTRVTTEHFDGIAAGKVVSTGAGEGIYLSGIPVTVGHTYTFSAYVKANAGDTCQVRIYDGKGEINSENVTMTGGWQRISVTRTIAAGSTEAVAYIFHNQAGTMHVDAAMFEDAAVVGTYFPTASQLASGEAGWSGTAHESASDIGVSVRNGVRTFCGVAASNHPSSAEYDMLLGQDIGRGIRIALNKNIFYMDLGYEKAGAEWPGTWPETTGAVFWALVWDDKAKTATLYINGENKGTKSLPNHIEPIPGDFVLGRDITVEASWHWNGSMLPSAVYFGALTAEEILELIYLPFELGVEYGAVYTLTGPNGTRAVFNNSLDPDYVGILSPESSGLDSAEVRENGNNTTEEDGGSHGDFWYGRRPVVLQGTVIATSKTDRATKISKIKRASNAMRKDATLTWTDANGAAVMLLLRRQQRVVFSKGWVKDFMIPMVSANAFIEAQPQSGAEVTIVSPQKSVKKFPGTQTVVDVRNEFGKHKEGTWTPANSGATAEDGTFTVSELLASAEKMLYLMLSNFNFGIPGTATILGVKAGIKRRASNGVEATIIDEEILLIQNAAVVGTNKAYKGAGWPAGAATQEYGGATDVWGAALTPANLNKNGANESGIAILPARTGIWSAGKKAEVDSVWLEVFYKEAVYPENEFTLNNNGDEDAYPEIIVLGPVENPVIENKTTGEKITLTGSVPAGNYLVIDVKNRTVKIGSENRYYMVDFLNTEWWKVAPGVNTISVRGDNATGATKCAVYFRDTYV